MDVTNHVVATHRPILTDDGAGLRFAASIAEQATQPSSKSSLRQIISERLATPRATTFTVRLPSLRSQRPPSR
jgi:hypothetical protein